MTLSVYDKADRPAASEIVDEQVAAGCRVERETGFIPEQQSSDMERFQR